MKVLRVISSMDPRSGGPCQGIRNTVPAMAKAGVQTEVVCLDDQTDAHVGSDTFPVHAVGPRKSPWGYASGLLPWLRENIGRFDAVIVHGLWLYHSHAVRSFMNTHKSKASSHPRWFIFPHGMLDPYFQNAPDRKMKALRNRVYWAIFESKVIHDADAVLFTSEEEMNLAQTSFRPYNPQKAINVGYGIVAPPPFSEAMSAAFQKRVPMAEGQAYLLYLSRIHSKKGLDDLIEAYAKLGNGNKLPILVIAGPGEDGAYGQHLKRLVASYPNVRDKVVFSGMLSGDAKWGAFYRCEAFVLPSHQENFGIAVVEALACGKPTLISNKVNIWREIESGNAGIVGPDTQEGTLDILKDWLALPEAERLSMGNMARKAYLDNFSVEKHVDRLIPILSGSFDND